MVNISFVQFDIKWGDVNYNIKKIEQLVAEHIKPKQIIFLPEMFATGFCIQQPHLAETMDGTIINWLKSFAKTCGCIIAGSVFIQDNQQFFNRLIWAYPNQTIHFYDKRHLFGYGNEHEYLSSGNKRVIASINGIKFNGQICYDLRFPVWARQQIQHNNPEYDVLYYCANWPTKRVEAWRTLLKARAIENQCYVIGVNRIGIDNSNQPHNGCSAIISPLGEVIAEAIDTETVINYTLQKTDIQTIREKFPFLQDADYFTINLK